MPAKDEGEGVKPMMAVRKNETQKKRDMEIRFILSGGR